MVLYIIAVQPLELTMAVPSVLPPYQSHRFRGIQVANGPNMNERCGVGTIDIIAAYLVFWRVTSCYLGSVQPCHLYLLSVVDHSNYILG